MLRRFASVMAVGAMALTSYGVMAAAPAAAGEGKNEIVVTKVVVGENIGEGYVVFVDCERIEDNGMARDFEAMFGGSSDEELVFPPEGGTKTVDKIRDGRVCTIIETHNGGATQTTVESDQDGNTCTFPKENDTINPTGPGASVSANLNNHEGKTCEVTVTNTFEEPQPVVGPAGPPGPPGECRCPEAAAARAVTAEARFTG